MIHGRPDYECFQDNTLAKELARLVLRMRLTSSEGLVASLFANMILYPEKKFSIDVAGIDLKKYPRIPVDEPVFLLRAQDIHTLPTLKFYHKLLLEMQAEPELLKSVQEQIIKIEEYHTRKYPDL